MAPDYSNNSFGVLTPESVPRSPAVQHGDVMFSRAVPPADFTSHAENADLQNLLNRAGENRDNLSEFIVDCLVGWASTFHRDAIRSLILGQEQ